MPAVLLAVTTAAAIAFLVFGPLRPAFSVLVVTTFLIPGALRPPGIHSAHLGIHRLLLAAFVINLFLKARRGKMPVDTLRPTRVHAALFAYVILTFVIGVVLGDTGVPISVSAYSWLFVVDQFVIFTIAVAMLRAMGDTGWFAKLLATVAVIIAGIAITEHFNHSSYAEWFFRRLPAQQGALGNHPLETRGGDVRVRAGADFALAYAWLATAMLPIVMAVGAYARRRVALVFPALVALSVVWTYTRSAYFGLGVVVLVLVVASRLVRRMTALALVGLLAALLLLAVSPAVSRAFRAPDVVGSGELREQRLPVVLRDVASRPLIGVGIATLSYSQGIKTTDASYLATYAEVGVVGLAALILLFGVVTWNVIPALRGPPGRRRTMSAAVLAGLVAGMMGAAAYDEFSVSQGFRLFWLIAALGVTLAERSPAPAGARRRMPVRIVYPLAGAALGVLVFLSVPAFGAATFRFNSLNAGVDVLPTDSVDFAGRTLTNTVCGVMEATARSVPGTVATCYDLRTGAGIGEVRVQAGDAAEAQRRVASMFASAKKAVPWVSFYVVDIVGGAKPTWVRTAPAWMAATGMGIALFLPPIPFRRTRLSPPVGSRLVRAT